MTGKVRESWGILYRKPVETLSDEKCIQKGARLYKKRAANGRKLPRKSTKKM